MKTFIFRLLSLLTTIKYRACCVCLIVPFIGSFVCYSNVQAAGKDKSIQYELTPYLWAASLSGTTAAQGEESPPVDSDYSFFSLDNLDGVASATFSARRKQWAFLFDYMYVAFEDTFFKASQLETTTRLEGDVIEFAGSYQPESLTGLDFIAGVRYQDIHVELTIFNKNTHASVDWYDPFVGVTYAHPFTNKIHMHLRGDVGGGKSDLAVNAEAMFRYQINKTISARFGYRYLKVQFSETDFLYDLTLDGFLLGVGFRF